MDQDDEIGTLGESLLQWVRSFAKNPQTTRWTDLSDGSLLWQILREIDDDFFSGELPESVATTADDWIRQWQNLKHVQKQVSTYYRDVCNGQEHASLQPDLQAIAAEHSRPDLQQLVMFILRTAMASPHSNQKMAQRLMGLGRERAMIIAGELRALEEEEQYETDEDNNTEGVDDHAEQDFQADTHTKQPDGGNVSAGMYRDPILEREEELLQSQAVIDKLQANYNVAQQQLSALRQDKAKLQEAFDHFREDMEGKGRRDIGDDVTRKLQQQAENDRSYIDDLESQLQSSRQSVEGYERQIAKHKQDSIVAQQLRDDIQLLRAENEDLNQKMKINDNLKKKIYTLQEQEKTADAIRDQLKQANERLQDQDRVKAQQQNLETEIIEKQGLIRNQEYQINELTTMRKNAEYNAHALAQKLEAAQEMIDRNHEALEELRQRVDEGTLDSDALKLPSQNDLDAKPKVDTAPVQLTASKNDEVKNLNEKLALLEKQLQAADIRLKQAAQRNAELEEKERQESASKDKAAQHVEDLEARTVELRKQLDLMSQRPKDETVSDQSRLQQENKLIASAWFDLSSRLQSNAVSLGRRRQEPKSWIGKQRDLVGPYNGLLH